MSTPRKVRLGFIGAGWWATANYIPLLAKRDDVELTAVCRLGAAELRRVKDHFGFPFATEDAGELVRCPGLDGVVVTSPHTLHYEHARLALEHGLHVLCDKPMCTRAWQARELVRLAAKKGLHLLVPYGWHYKPFVRQARRWMDEGAIGRVQFALCHMASPIRDLLQGKKFQADENSGQAGGVLFEPDPRTWADPAVAGGGYGHAQLSHSTGMLCWLTGLSPASVHAFMSAPDAAVDLYDALSVRFEGGAIGTVSGAGTAPPVGPTQYQVDLRLFGSEGMLLLDCERARLELRRHDGRVERLDLAPDAGAYTCDGPPNNFADLLLGKTDVNGSPGEAAMRSVLLLDAAYRSAASGRVEHVLDAVYRATSYFVNGPTGRFALRIGAVSPEVDALAASHGVDAWAYITAYNPGSAPAPRERNEARQRELEQVIAEAGYRFYRGEGKGDDGGWESEPSLLVLGVGEDAAAALGRRFGQAAVVVGERGGAARLVWTNVEQCGQ